MLPPPAGAISCKIIRVFLGTVAPHALPGADKFTVAARSFWCFFFNAAIFMKTPWLLLIVSGHQSGRDLKRNTEQPNAY